MRKKQNARRKPAPKKSRLAPKAKAPKTSSRPLHAPKTESSPLQQPLLEKEMYMIHEVAGLMRQGLTYYEALKLVLKCVVAALKCERAEIYLVEESDQTLGREIAISAEGRYETGASERVQLGEHQQDPFSRLVYGKVGFVADAELASQTPAGSTFNVKVPIRAAGRALGVLSVDYLGAIRPRNRSEVLGLLTFATQVGFILENIRLHFEIIQLAFKDELTGQYNHRFWVKRLQEEVDRSTRYKHAFSVICLGLDGFSKFNETYGFAMGDRILRDLGSWVKRSVRTCDLVARPGGDQFFILLPETGVEGGLIVAEKLRRGIEQFDYAADAGLRSIQQRPTVSVSVTGYPEHGLMIEQLMERANTALHAAKSGGGNRAQVAFSATARPTPKTVEGTSTRG